MLQAKSSTFYIKLAVWIAIIAVIWNIPPTGALTAVGMHNLAVFAGLIVGMITLGFIIPCIGCLILIAFSGAYVPVAPGQNAMGMALSAGWGGSTFIMIFSILLISGIIIYSGLARIIALRIINLKITTGRPWMLTFLILLTSAVLSIFILPLVIIIIMSQLTIEIMKNLNIEKGNRWALLTLIAIAVVSITAQDIMPFQFGVALMFGLTSQFDPRLALGDNTGTFMLIGFIYLVIIFAFCFILIRVTCKKSIEKVYAHKGAEEKEPFTKDAKIAGVVLIIYILFQLIPLLLPAGNVIREFCNFVTLPGSGFLIALIAMMIYKKGGVPFITMKNISETGLDWNILMMLVAIGGVTGPMTSEITGISAWLTDVVNPIVATMGPYGIFAFICVACLIATNFSDNLAIAFVIVPVIATITVASGLNGLSMSTWALHALQIGIFLPCATPHIAIIFTKEDTGYVSRTGIMKWTALTVAFIAIVFLTFGWATYNWFPNVMV